MSAGAGTGGAPARRWSRWVTVGIPLVLAGLVAVAAAVALAPDPGTTAGRRIDATASMTRPAPSSALEGEWSGTGSLTDCAGFDQGCAATLSIPLSVDCSADACAVTPLGPGHGRPPLRFEDGRYRAAGPVPPERAPTCGGTPTRSALWRLDLVLAEGRLIGSYSESTVQGFDCGATWVAWEVALARR